LSRRSGKNISGREQASMSLGETKCWSACDREYYTTSVDGMRHGIGVHPAMMIPGFWNLLWLLSAEHIEQLLFFNGPPEEFPYSNPQLFPVIAAMALTTVADGYTIGEHAATRAPLDFLDFLSKLKEKTPLEIAYGNTWVAPAIKNAKSYTERSGKIVNLHAFRSSRLQ
jgi:hypothetical protein